MAYIGSVYLKDVRHWVPAGGHRGSDYIFIANSSGDTVEATMIVSSKPADPATYTPKCSSQRVDITFTKEQAITFANQLLEAAND